MKLVVEGVLGTVINDVASVFMLIGEAIRTTVGPTSCRNVESVCCASMNLRVSFWSVTLRYSTFLKRYSKENDDSRERSIR